MKRAFVYSLALAGLVFADAASAQAPPPGAADKPLTGRIAVFNVVKVMRDYKKWQHYTGVMNARRTEAAAELAKAGTRITDLQTQLQAEKIPGKQEELAKKIIEEQRVLEDTKRTIGKKLEDETAAYLKNLFLEIQVCVDAVVESNGFDVVFAYPDATTDEERQSPMYFDLKLRLQAAMPFFVKRGADMTDMLIETLNKHFPPPVTQAGAALPAAGPGVPGK